MKKCLIEIEMDNDAFVSNPRELSHILAQLAAEFPRIYPLNVTNESIKDHNGNIVGKMIITEKDMAICRNSRPNALSSRWIRQG